MAPSGEAWITTMSALADGYLADRSERAKTGRARRADRVGARWRRGWPRGMWAGRACRRPDLHVRAHAAPLRRYASSVLRHGCVLKRDGRFARGCALTRAQGRALGARQRGIGPLPMPTSTA